MSQSSMPDPNPVERSGALRVGVWTQSRLVQDGFAAWLARHRPTVLAVPIVTRSPALAQVHVLVVVGAGSTPTHARSVIDRFRRHGVAVLEVDASAKRPERVGIDHWLLPGSISIEAIVELAVRLAVKPAAELGLTRREAEALLLYAQGSTVREAAEHLGVEQETVRTFIRRARTKLRSRGIDVSSREALRVALSDRVVGAA